MKILFISGMYEDSLVPEFQKHSSVPLQNAPDVFQKAILRGLVENNADFSVVSYPFLPSYPFNYSKYNIPCKEIKYDGKTVGLSDEFCTLFLLKKKSVQRRLYRQVMNWIKQNDITNNDFFAILTYTPSPSFLSPLARIKELYPHVIICSIITDLIDNAKDFASNRSILKGIQFSIEKKQIHKAYRTIDKFVLLSEAMIEKIPQAKDNHIIIEGVYGGAPSKQIAKKTIPRMILYTGALLSFAGIMNFIESFNRIKNQDAVLCILGSGECKAEIESAVEKNPRIKFLGVQPREVALRYQKEAVLLVNPRKPNGDLTKYSFPSKTMEYLASGTPMIGYRLEGIPDEYFKHIYSPKDLTSESMTSLIDELLLLPQDDLNMKGEQAQDFIFNNKLSKHQVRKILNYLEEK